jgi:hypothetical protein
VAFFGLGMDFACDAPSLFSTTHDFTFHSQLFQEHSVGLPRKNVDKVVL